MKKIYKIRIRSREIVLEYEGNTVIEAKHFAKSYLSYLKEHKKDFTPVIEVEEIGKVDEREPKLKKDISKNEIAYKRKKKVYEVI